ncbi:MAG: EAL domain-containing protein [Deltaproteobacteria bacterium]|nr:EAL domain-containing protein [Deltaproteobacteria bacterium]
MDSQGRVLIVDDEASVVRALTRALRHEGFAIEEAASAEAALEFIESLGTGTLDVVLSDIHMPGRSGVQLLEAMRRRDPDLPVILMTAVPAIDTAVKAVEHGALRYLTKPVELPALVEALTYAVRLRKMAGLKREAAALLGRESTDLDARNALDASLTRAFDAVWMAYQPIASLDRRCVYAYEALVRSREPSLSNPLALIDAATRLGRLNDLGRVVRRAVGTLALEHQGPELFFINLHPNDLLDPDLYRIDSPLGLCAPRVVLEVTERMSLEGIPDLKNRVSSLRRMGFRLAVDDLGAGYAGLSSLAWIEPEVLKLDMSLVRDIHTEATKQRLAGSMLKLARDMGILAVAEGVETAAERDMLASLGADLIQGYLVARPSPTLDTPRWDTA